jgi:hypothetical protein
MKNQNVLIALIMAGAMLISAFIVSSGLKRFGRSVERAGQSIGSGVTSRGHVTIPSSLRVNLGEIRIGNAGGGGQSFRIQTSDSKQL